MSVPRVSKRLLAAVSIAARGHAAALADATYGLRASSGGVVARSVAKSSQAAVLAGPSRRSSLPKGPGLEHFLRQHGGEQAQRPLDLPTAGQQQVCTASLATQGLLAHELLPRSRASTCSKREALSAAWLDGLLHLAPSGAPDERRSRCAGRLVGMLKGPDHRRWTSNRRPQQRRTPGRRQAPPPSRHSSWCTWRPTAAR